MGEKIFIYVHMQRLFGKTHKKLINIKLALGRRSLWLRGQGESEEMLEL